MKCSVFFSVDRLTCIQLRFGGISLHVSRWKVFRFISNSGPESAIRSCRFADFDKVLPKSLVWTSQTIHACIGCKSDSQTNLVTTCVLSVKLCHYYLWIWHFILRRIWALDGSWPTYFYMGSGRYVYQNLHHPWYFQPWSCHSSWQLHACCFGNSDSIRTAIQHTVLICCIIKQNALMFPWGRGSYDGGYFGFWPGRFLSLADYCCRWSLSIVRFCFLLYEKPETKEKLYSTKMFCFAF